MMILRIMPVLLSILVFCLVPSFGDVISGVVTDQGDGSPLPDVKISLGDRETRSAEDGSYTIDTEAAGIAGRSPVYGIQWNPAQNAFTWIGVGEQVVIQVRSIRGSLLDLFDSRSTGTDRYRVGKSFKGIFFVSAFTGDYRQSFRMLGMNGRTFMMEGSPGVVPISGPLAKRAAINFLTYEKEGYVRAVEEVDGSSDNVNVALARIDTAGAEWRQANLTWYTSYPDPGSEECIEYNGCQWAGYFAGVDGKMTEEWVAAHNIAAVHGRDFDDYRLKTLRLRRGEHVIDVTVYDMCSDSDCDGCCTRNSSETGFLIDIETYTAERFGVNGGIVDWICLDCGNY